MRAAIQQSANSPDAAAPSQEFVTGLHQRLRAEIEDHTDSYDAEQPALSRPHPHRRRVLQVAAGAAGAAALFAAGEQVDQLRTPDSGGGTLDPESGRWTPVATQAEVSAHPAVTFSVANVAGVVTTDSGRLAALSGICTHQGCLLRLDAALRRLDCPCHATAFSLTGEVLHHAMRKAPAPLPHLQVRERGGHIEVLLPPE